MAQFKAPRWFGGLRPSVATLLGLATLAVVIAAPAVFSQSQADKPKQNRRVPSIRNKPAATDAVSRMVTVHRKPKPPKAPVAKPPAPKLAPLTAPPIGDDAVSREVTLFATVGSPTATDAVSREITLYRRNRKSFTDAVSREVTIGQAPPQVFADDAVSREVTLLRQTEIATATDAVSREATLYFKKRVRVTDAVSRELTLFTRTTDKVIPTDAVSRELTLAAPVPDLVVLSASAPDEIWTDTSVTVRWSDRNRGKGSARGPWIDRVALSDDDQPGNDTTLSDFPFGGVIKPATTTSRRGEIVIPKELLTSVVQDKWLIFTADLNDNVFERDQENNNWFALKIRVKKSPIPDLIIKPGSLVVPATAFSEQEIEARFVVKNVGTASTDASEWADWIHLSPDDVPHSNDIVRVSSTNIAYLDPDQEYTVTARFRIPRGTFGNYKVVAFADGDADLGVNAVRELDEANNTLSAPIKIDIAPYPDFQVPSVTAPTQAFAGGKIDVSWKVVNKGPGNIPPADRVWSDRVYFSKDTTLDASDRRAEINGRTGNVAPLGVYVVKNFSVNVPKDIEGDWYVLVQADDGNQVYEFVYEGNNVGVSNVDGTPRLTHITIAPPDFVVTSLKVPATANGADMIDAEWTVKNDGGFDSDIGPWVDTVYMSRDAVLDGGDTPMGDFFQSGPLVAGASYTRKEKIRIPDCEDGDRWFFVVTDRSNRVIEFDGESNNTSTAQPMKVSANAPNLVISALSVPGTTTAGGSLNVSWTVANTGVGTTRQAQWTDTIMLSRDLNGLVEPRILASYPHVGVLLPGKNYKQTQPVSMPIDLYGNYYVTVLTDFGNQVPECDKEGDNLRRSGVLRVTSNLPNMVISGLTAEASWKVGTSTTVGWTGKNLGPAALPFTGWRDQVWLSRDKVLGGGDVPLGFASFLQALAVGAVYDGSASFAVPLVASGDWYVLVRADDNNQIYEGANEGDNVSVARIVRIDTPDVDLTVPAVDAPDTAIAGQAITVTWSVTNSGVDPTLASSWYDRVFLSKDKTLDPTDLPMGWSSRQSGLSGGDSYSASATIDIPTGLSGPYFALVLTDVGNVVYEKTPDGELNNLGVDPGVIQIKLPPPVDLTVETITVPVAAELGERVTVPFRIKNRGTSAAVGAWLDAVYLSVDKVWSSDDELLGRVWHAGGLLAGGAYGSAWEGDLPGVEPGKYYVIVRADVRNKVRESDERNNVRTSTTQMTATVKTIPSGVWSDTQLDWLRSKYVRTATAAGDTLQWDIQDTFPDAWNDLFAKVNRVARPFNYEARSEPFATNASATLPETAAGHAYATFTRVSPVSSGNAAKVRPTVVPFGLTNVSPRLVGNVGQVSFVLKGGRMKDIKSARLVGVTKTQAAAEIEIQDGANAVARFMFDSLPVGAYALEITNSAGVVSRFVGLTVEAGARFDLQKTIAATTTVRRGGSPFVESYVLTNTGNVDIPIGLMHVQAQESGLKITINRPSNTYPVVNEKNTMLAAASRELGASTTQFLMFADLPAQQSLTISITIPIPATTRIGPLPITVATTAFTRPGFAKVLETLLERIRLSLVTSTSEIPAPLRSALGSAARWRDAVIDSWQSSGIIPPGSFFASESDPDSDLLRRPAASSNSCEGNCTVTYILGAGLVSSKFGYCVFIGMAVPPPGDAVAFGYCLIWSMIDFSLITAQYTCCLNNCDQRPVDCGYIRNLCNVGTIFGAVDPFGVPLALLNGWWRPIVTSVGEVMTCIVGPRDPNDLLGPNSVGDPAYVSPNHPWTYRTRFENQATAGAAANRVHVESTLPDSLDRKTTKLSAVGLGDQTIALGDNAFVSQRKRLTLNGKELDVYFSGGINVQTGKISMDIEAIDPETGEPPESPLVGLLLPEDGTGRGNGYFEFSVNCKPNLSTGTKVRLQAAIQFDEEPVMATNVVTNTVEADLPTSQIDALPTESTSETVTLTYKASDPTAGLDGVDIWCRVDDGAYTKVAGMVRTGTQTFTGTKGHTYRFYSIAIDKVGNAELAPTTPDAVVTIR